MSEQASRTSTAEKKPAVPQVPVLAFGWPSVLEDGAREALQAALLAYVTPRRWFRAKNRGARSARVLDLVPLPGTQDVLAVLEIGFDSGAPERYLVPLAVVEGIEGQEVARRASHALIAWLAADGGPGAQPAGAARAALVDGLATGSAAGAFRSLVQKSDISPGQAGELIGLAHPPLAELGDGGAESPKVAPLEQTNSTVSFGERMLLKIYRQLTPGINPELEMGTFLDSHAAAASRPTPPVLGALSYQTRDGTKYGVGIMHAFVPSDGDAWSAVQRELQEVLGGAAGSAPTDQQDLGRFIGRAATLGRRTAEIHLALARATPDDDAFRCEPLTEADRRAAAERARAMLDEQLAALQARVGSLSADARGAAERLADPQGPGRRAFADVCASCVAEETGVAKTRILGDLHLGQVLARGDDFTIIDFEGEPARPLAERRAKASPLRDVMGMVRSFSYAPEAVLRAGGAEPDRRKRLLPLARRWQDRATEEYRRGYLSTAAGAPFLPKDPRHLKLMLDFYALERVIYEIGYELNNRTAWVDIPLAGLLALVQQEGPREQR